MIRMEANGILRFSLTELPAAYDGMAVTVDMSPSDDLGDIESISLYTGDADGIYSAPAYGSSGHGAMSTTASLPARPSRRAPVMTFPVTPGGSHERTAILLLGQRQAQELRQHGPQGGRQNHLRHRGRAND